VRCVRLQILSTCTAVSDRDNCKINISHHPQHFLVHVSHSHMKEKLPKSIRIKKYEKDWLNNMEKGEGRNESWELGFCRVDVQRVYIYRTGKWAGWYGGRVEPDLTTQLTYLRWIVLFRNVSWKLMYTHLVRLRNTCKRRNCPSTYRRGIHKPTAVNCRGKQLCRQWILHYVKQHIQRNCIWNEHTYIIYYFPPYSET